MITIVATDLLWSEDAPGMASEGCQLFAGDKETTQLNCQAICLYKTECLGILYTHRKVPEWLESPCAICNDDKNFEKSNNGFGFYRRPGNT